MNDQANYPKRGQMSDDGKVYTNLEGVVLRKDSIGSVCDAKHCQVCVNKDGWCAHWNVIEGAYVPSDCELEACEMARAQIEFCSTDIDCEMCGHFETRLCPVRKYLAAHGDTKAWEV